MAHTGVIPLCRKGRQTLSWFPPQGALPHGPGLTVPPGPWFLLCFLRHRGKCPQEGERKREDEEGGPQRCVGG